MDWIELIHLRTASEADRNAALAVFRQMDWSDWECDLNRIRLLSNGTLAFDLTLLIDWRGPASPTARSPLGLRLAAAFSEFGQVNHSYWNCEACIDATHRSNHHEYRM